MNKSFLTGTISGLVLALPAFLIIFYLNQDRIVVVDSQQVLHEYKGFVEAQDYFESKIEELKDGFNKKKLAYEQKVKEYEILENELTQLELSEKQQELTQIQRGLVEIGKEIESQSNAEEQKLLEGVLNKINDFIKRYGDEKGYSIMLGANGQGNVMYVKEATDVTQEVIQALNKEYMNGVE